MIDYGRYRAAIETLYEDQATISRMVETKDPDTKETKQMPQEVYADRPCRLSQTALPKDGQTEDANNILYDAKLFISPELEIRQGDIVDVTVRGATRSYAAGEPFRYGSHQEIGLTRKEWA